MVLLIIALIIVGVLFLIAELILLPGLSIAGICALVAYGGASYFAFNHYGTATGIVVIIVIVALSIVALIVSMKSKTWQKLALKDQLKGSSQPLPELEGIKVGDRGETTTRLAPMGKVSLGTAIFEAKSAGVFIDQSTPIEVIGFDNFTVIVKQFK